MARLAEHGVDACHALWTGSTAAGSRWRCYGECGCTGLVPPSSTSPLMAAARAEGRVVRADRAELERLVAPVDERVLRRREALLDARRRRSRCHLRGVRRLATALAAGRCRGGAAVGCGGQARAGAGCPADRPAIDVVEDRGARRADAARGWSARGSTAPRGRPAPASTAATPRRVRRRPTWSTTAGGALARALQIPVVRDAAVAACTGSRPAAAEALWAALARGTPDPEAAEPAALLALMALLQRRRGAGQRRSAAGRARVARSPPHGDAARSRGGGHPPERAARLPDRRTRAHRDRQRSSATAPRRRRAPRPTRRRKRRR